VPEPLARNPAMTTIARMIGAVAVALVAALFTTFAVGLILTPIESLGYRPVVYYLTYAVEGACRGFAFTFAGSLFAPKRRRAIAALCLVPVGVGLYIYDHASYAVSAHGFPWWHFLACVAGGLLASGLQARRAPGGEGPQTASSGGPAMPPGASGVSERPPSVSR
jgi:hypothetical protein